MKVLYCFLGIFCLLLTGCVSEQWVRGYVQHELAGVKDIVTEEVYPTEKALTDVRTQMASIIVELKGARDELQAIKESVPVGDKKWEEMGQKAVAQEKDLKRLEGELQGLTEDLQKLHLSFVQVQTSIETISKGLESGMGGQKTIPEISKEKISTLDKVGDTGVEPAREKLKTISIGQKLLQKLIDGKDFAKEFYKKTTAVDHKILQKP